MSEEHGVIRVAPEVIQTVARRTAVDVSGVARLVPRSEGGVGRVLRGNADEGVVVTINDGDDVTVEVSLIADAGADVVDVGKRLQAALQRAIEELIGMHVHAVNVHVEDVTFASTER